MAVKLDDFKQQKRSGSNQINHSYVGAESGNERQLRSELQSKDGKIQEQNKMI